MPDYIRTPEAAQRLQKPETTVRVWGTRYGARKILLNGRSFFDYADLATIDGCIARGERVPKTPEARDELRENLRKRWQHAA
jgi:hypothetical protein